MENRKYRCDWRKENGFSRDLKTRSSGLEAPQKQMLPEKHLQQKEEKRGAILNFKDLLIWKTGKDLVVDIYRLTRSFPQEERFGLADQMRRASISIPCNIAEGFNRKYSRDYSRFLFIALGSCGELDTQLEIALSLQLLTRERAQAIMEKLDHESRMVRKLLGKIQASIAERKKPSKKTSLEERVPSPMEY